MKKQDHILLIINDSWGEVDWILPVLWHLNTCWNVKITVFFKSDEIYDEKSEYKDLYKLLDLVSDEIITQQSLSERMISDENRLLHTIHDLLRKKLCNGIDYIFHDYSGVDYSQFYNDFAQAKVVVFPHGTFVYGWMSEKLRKDVSKTLFFDKIPKDALLLLGSENDVSFFKELTKNNNIVVSGHPKFEKRWVKTLTGVEGERQNIQINNSEKPKILFIQYPRRRIKGKDVFENLALSVFEFAKECGAEIIIKKHPRQDKNELTRLVEKDEGSMVRFADESVLSSASKSHVAISFPSSACMDAIVAGIPVIEYFDYELEEWSTFAQSGDRSTSIYRKMGLVLPANSIHELIGETNEILNNPEYRRLTIYKQRESLEKWFKINGHSLDTLVAALLAL